MKKLIDLNYRYFYSIVCHKYVKIKSERMINMSTTTEKKTSTTTVRLNTNLKKEVTKQLKNTGISLNAYFTMAAQQLVLQKRIPFEILTEARVPNDTTKKAMLEAEAKAAGVIPDESPEFDNVEDLIKSLDED